MAQVKDSTIRKIRNRLATKESFRERKTSSQIHTSLPHSVVVEISLSQLQKLKSVVIREKT